MLFNSYIFIFFFLPLTIAGYYLLNHYGKNNWAKVELIVMSLGFYGYFNYSYLFIICGSVLVNYIFSKVILKYRSSAVIAKGTLTLGVFFNIALIFYFKYFDFFISNINILFNQDYVLKNIVLPLGISFFTFQQISYVVDSYRGETKAYTFCEYMLFVTFFPQLVAGPIVLHNEMIPQFKEKCNIKINYENWNKGIIYFTFGLVKKVLIADTFGIAVNWGYSNVEIMGCLDTIIVILAYTLQIYFDFSGYCDMATGIALFFNIELPRNFNSPYKATSIIEFWDRWHMTLSRFLKQYIYFPLGGSRKGKLRTYINVLIVFFVSGVWHGANWTFIIWGCLHGVANVFTRILGKHWERVNKYIRQVITFIFINVTWVFFRASSLQEACEILSKLTCVSKGLSAELIQCFVTIEWKALSMFIPFINNMLVVIVIFMLGLGMYVALTQKNIYEIQWEIGSKWLSLLVAVLLVWCVVSLSGVTTFLYFNF